MVYIGIDGGGTKTDAVMLDQEGKVISVFQSGATNPRSVTLSAATRNLSALFDHFMSINPLQRPAAICLGLAGVSREQEKEDILQFIRRYYIGHGYKSVPHIILTTDAEIAMMCTLEEKQGIVVISGTGSIVYGITPSGKHWRTGGWGHLLGDQGSGYAIGLCTLQAAMKSYDGVTSSTMLTAFIEEQYSFKSITELREYIYQSHIHKKDIAAFAKICINAAKLHDETAMDIIISAAADLALFTHALRRKDSWLNTADIGLHGSIFEHSELYTETFKQHIQAESAAKTLSFHTAKYSPAHGAALLARKTLWRS